MSRIAGSTLHCSLAALLLSIANIARAAGPAPTVTLTPPDGARFLTNQRFDLRVEIKGTAPFSASLKVDNIPVAFTGKQDPTTTDGITKAGYGGFNVRGFSVAKAGVHTLTAQVSDANGSASATASFQIIDVTGNRKPAKNIIICLGDGMGVAHRTIGRLVRYGVTNGHPNNLLTMDQFPGTGWVTTHSLNSIITDSAPGMACYSSGSHFANNQEGVYPANVTNPFYAPRVEYMSEYLHRMKGKTLGLVTTADIEDATPAANAVHTMARGNGTGICDQYLDESGNTGLAVLMGGGRRWFLPSAVFGSSRAPGNDYDNLPEDLRTAWGVPAGQSDPSRDLIGDFQKAGFAYADSLSGLTSAFSGGAPNRLLGLFGYGNMNVALDKLAKRRGKLIDGATTFAVDDYHAPDQPMLDEMADAALRVLGKNPNGFVLMVEGAHIDKQSHAMDADRVIDEVLEFDRAVNVCAQYADTAGDTVVIVLADHECSGFSLIGALNGTIAKLKGLGSDSGSNDPADKPGRQAMVGTYDAAGFPHYNILPDGYPETLDIDGKILVGFGASGNRYEGWLTKPRPIIDSLLTSTIQGELSGRSYPAQPVDRQRTTTGAFGDSGGFFLRGQATADEQAVHTATDIPVTAYSTGTRAYQQFYGVQENTDVFFKLMRAALGGF